MDQGKHTSILTENQNLIAENHRLAGTGFGHHNVTSLSAIDVSTQADIHQTLAASYESEDETMGRRNKISAGSSSCTDITRNKRGTPLYSKEDIREQYCITDRQLDVLEKARSHGGFFGCLSNYQDSPCTSSSTRASLLSVCVRRKVPSDENIHELCRRQPSDFAPYPRYPRYPFTAPTSADLYAYDEALECSYFRRRPRSTTCMISDPKRYTWMPEDEESIRMERPRPIRPTAGDIEGDPNYVYDQQHRGGYATSSLSRPTSRQSTISGGSSMPINNYLSYSSEYLPTGVQQSHHHYVCPAHPPDLPPPPPPPAILHHDGTIHPHRQKHVSFARSHTLTSFEDVTKLTAITTRSQERLLDGKKTADPLPLTRPTDIDVHHQEMAPKVVVLEKVKRGPMKTQATQTEVCLGRKPNNLTLSPRTIQRVKMVSQGAQTNGGLFNGRKLTKSYSEAGSKFGIPVPTSPFEHFFGDPNVFIQQNVPEHEPLQRTQSEEPPKSPYMINDSPPAQIPQPITTQPQPTLPERLKSPPQERRPSKQEETKPEPQQILPPPTPPAAVVPEKEDEDESDSTQKEIIIDFEPQISPEPITEPRTSKKRVLIKTMSEGEILQERRKSQITDEELIVDQLITSSSQENIKSEPERSFTPYFLNSPILHEDIFKEPPSGPPSGLFSPVSGQSATAGFRMQESVDEEFHENLILWERQQSVDDGISLTSDVDNLDISQPSHQRSSSSPKSGPSSPSMDLDAEKDEESVVPTFEEKVKSPFASSDSLNNDIRDHSDGIWNESQVTVLQADSGTDNGTVLSTSDLSSLTATSPGSGTLLTPSSRRKHLLLLQHQQRSSMDTDALEEEFQFDHMQNQLAASPKVKKDMNMIIQPMASAPITTTMVTVTPPTIAVTPIPSRRPPKLQEAPQSQTHPTPAPIPSVRRSPAKGELRKQRRSPITRTPDLTPSETPHRSLESPDNVKAIQAAAEMLLGKTDSGKTTDISESTTTTTDDYVTANSDSSRRSGSLHGTSTQSTFGSQTGTQDGSSFESASSIYSLARGEAICEDLIIPPSFSPPPILEESLSEIPLTPELQATKQDFIPQPLEVITVEPPASADQRRASSKEPTSPSGESSSSCGSYSIQGSHADILTATKKELQDQKEKQRSKIDHHQRPTVPLPTKQQQTREKGESISDDDNRSVHYSSSGNYESPGDEDDHEDFIEDNKRRSKLTRRPGERKEWSEEEKRRRKKGFTLEFTEKSDDGKKRSPGGNGCRDIPSEMDKMKRTKSRSPQRMSSARKGGKKSDKESTATTPGGTGMVRSPAMHDGFRPEDWGAVVRTPPHEEVPTVAALTSDESSGGGITSAAYNLPETNGQSPRRHRRIRGHEAPSRRKSSSIASKSPISSGSQPSTSSTSHRQRRRSGSVETSNKTIITGGSTLPRRRSSMQPKVHAELENLDLDVRASAGLNRLSPHRYTKSPGGSPRKMRKVMDNSEIVKLKAVSAESLRSVSPGSDSVFYSEGSGGTTTINEPHHQCVHCLHCGKEVDIVTTDDLDDGHQMEVSPDGKDLPPADIVRPPADFADSPDGPRTKHSTGRLYKKLDKRYRSEERSYHHGERRHHHRYRQDVRAKSEERGKEESARVKLRPLARSTDTSLEALKATASSPSIIDDEDDLGIYCEPYKSGIWIFIGDNEEKLVWYKQYYQRSQDGESFGDRDDIDIGEIQSPDSTCSDSRRDSIQSMDSTNSEHEFRKRYQCVTHRMVHRKSCLEMYKRQASKCFANNNEHTKNNISNMMMNGGINDTINTDSNDVGSLQRNLQDLFKLMLMVWCKENEAIKIITAQPTESDKTVTVTRSAGEFGFRIHGSKPVVVSAIEPDTPAESSGLEVGDIVICVNGINVLDKSHSEVVKIAHSGSDTLELQVTRTCDVLAPPESGIPVKEDALYSGYLWKLTKHNQKWVRRWFVLKRDNCLYYYKLDGDTQPIGAIMLVNYQITRTPDCGKPYGFNIEKSGASGLQLAGDNDEATTRWVAVISHAIERSTAADTWLEATRRNLRLAPQSIHKPDCFGYLNKLGTKWKSWVKRYCVLKDACLYFYQDANAKNAYGMACLHGYRVQQAAPGGKKHAFEVIPPDSSQKHLYFHTESDLDRKRWLAALEYSIDRWLRVG